MAEPNSSSWQYLNYYLVQPLRIPFPRDENRFP